MSDSRKRMDGSMESMIRTYLSREVGKPESNFKNDTQLFESGILNSLSLIKLVLFLEQQFDLKVGADELIPENFKTIDAMCIYLRSK